MNHLVSCWHLSAIVEGLSKRSAKYCLLRLNPVFTALYVWLEYFWVTSYDARLMTAPCKHLQSCMVDALSCAGPAIHSHTNLTKISKSSSIAADGNWLNLSKTSVSSSHTSQCHLLFFVAEGRRKIKSFDWWRRECPCSSVAQCRRTIHGQESISSTDLDHMQFTAAVNQSLGELTSHWLLWKECQCHWLLPSGLPHACLLLSHDWYVRRSSCPPPHEYTGQIHPGRSCGCWWNLLLISMIIFSHCFWEQCAC